MILCVVENDFGANASKKGQDQLELDSDAFFDSSL